MTTTNTDTLIECSPLFERTVQKLRLKGYPEGLIVTRTSLINEDTGEILLRYYTRRVKEQKAIAAVFGNCAKLKFTDNYLLVTFSLQPNQAN